MLEKPELSDAYIITCLKSEYGLSTSRVTFLPLGVDENAAVYHIFASNNKSYFLKLKRGDFDGIALDLLHLLSECGIAHIIAPLMTLSGQLSSRLENYQLMLYPFIAGKNGYELELSDIQWREFGAMLQAIHKIELPSHLSGKIRREEFSPHWRNRVKSIIEMVADITFIDAVTQKVVLLLKENTDQIQDLVNRAERLAFELQKRPMAAVLCHADLHPGNILMDEKDGFYIVDWDAPIFAHKERDLMFVAFGIIDERIKSQMETAFYQGYGEVEIDQIALSYYRYERIIEDIAVFCEQLLFTNQGGKDREQSFSYLASNFLPGGEIEIAYKFDATDRTDRNISW